MKNNKTVLIEFQKDEATAHLIYGKLSKKIKNKKNSEILEKIAKEENGHYHTFKSLTGKDVNPDRFYAFFVIAAARILGLTFALKLMEKSEEAAQAKYSAVIESFPELKKTIDDEEKHEQELLGMLEEEKLEYVGSMVLGLNDALVELTGALAGLTFAFKNTQLIALSGLITGIAASLSMASSEYLSHRTEGKSSQAVKASVYTGIAYIITVALLILPYLLLSNYMNALFLTLATAIFIIFIFNYYISVAKDISFKKHFTEMALLSMGVSALSFGIGILVKQVLGIEV